MDLKPVNESVSTRDFKYYIFDWDDNILHMPTKIFLEHKEKDGTWRPVAVSTSTYAVIRTDREHYREPSDGGWTAAFRNFQDLPVSGNGQAFLDDTSLALDKIASGEVKPGPSFETLRKTLREGRIFAIVTARGHRPETLEAAVRLFIKKAMTDDERAEMLANLRGYRRWLDKAEPFDTDEEELNFYLSMCRYWAVTNPDFKATVEADPVFLAKVDGLPHAAHAEIAKEFAIRDFVEHILRTLRRRDALGLRQISIGFSDDDARNVSAVSSYVQSELVKLYSGFKFVVYDTSDPSLSNGRKVTIAGQLNLPGF